MEEPPADPADWAEWKASRFGGDVEAGIPTPRLLAVDGVDKPAEVWTLGAEELPGEEEEDDMPAAGKGELGKRVLEVKPASPSASAAKEAEEPHHSPSSPTAAVALGLAGAAPSRHPTTGRFRSVDMASTLSFDAYCKKLEESAKGEEASERELEGAESKPEGAKGRRWTVMGSSQLGPEFRTPLARRWSVTSEGGATPLRRRRSSASDVEAGGASAAAIAAALASAEAGHVDEEEEEEEEEDGRRHSDPDVLDGEREHGEAPMSKADQARLAQLRLMARRRSRSEVGIGNALIAPAGAVAGPPVRGDGTGEGAAAMATPSRRRGSLVSRLALPEEERVDIVESESGELKLAERPHSRGSHGSSGSGGSGALRPPSPSSAARRPSTPSRARVWTSSIMRSTRDSKMPDKARWMDQPEERAGPAATLLRVLAMLSGLLGWTLLLAVAIAAYALLVVALEERHWETGGGSGASWHALSAAQQSTVVASSCVHGLLLQLVPLAALLLVYLHLRPMVVRVLLPLAALLGACDIAFRVAVFSAGLYGTLWRSLPLQLLWLGNVIALALLMSRAVQFGTPHTAAGIVAYAALLAAPLVTALLMTLAAAVTILPAFLDAAAAGSGTQGVLILTVPLLFILPTSLARAAAFRLRGTAPGCQFALLALLAAAQHFLTAALLAALPTLADLAAWTAVLAASRAVFALLQRRADLLVDSLLERSCAPPSTLRHPAWKELWADMTLMNAALPEMAAVVSNALLAGVHVYYRAVVAEEAALEAIVRVAVQLAVSIPIKLPVMVVISWRQRVPICAAWALKYKRYVAVIAVAAFFSTAFAAGRMAALLSATAPLAAA